MTTPIVYQGIEVGLVLSSSDVDGELYEVLALKRDLVLYRKENEELCSLLNVDKREGYAIYPIKDSFDNYVWYDHPNQILLCLARGLWG